MRTGFCVRARKSTSDGVVATAKKAGHRLVPPEGFATRTIFAHKIARERQSLFGQKCEPVFAREHAKARPMEWWQLQKRQDTVWCPAFFGGATRIRTGGRGVADLCLTAWPWRHIRFEHMDYIINIYVCQGLLKIYLCIKIHS